MTDKKWSEYEKLVLSKLETSDERMTRLEDRANKMGITLSKVVTENKIILGVVVVFLTGLITMAFRIYGS